MTLIAALRCREGVVLCSDSQQTRGTPGRRLARSTQKVYEPRRGFLLATAGAQDVAQEFALRLQRAPGVSAGADRLRLKSHLQELLAGLRGDPSIDSRSNYVEFILAWWSRHEHKPLALHLLSGGAVEWVDEWAFAGTQLGIEIASFAVGTMRHLAPGRLPLEQAKVVALKVLRDTIEAGVEGIGGPVQIGAVACTGVHVIAEPDKQNLHRAVDLWERRCAESLLRNAGQPAVDQAARQGVLSCD